MIQYVLIGASFVGIFMLIYSMRLFDKFQKQLLEVFALDKPFHHKVFFGYRQLFVVFIVGYFLEFVSAILGGSGVDSRLVLSILLFFGAVFVMYSVRFQGRLLRAVLNARMQQVDELTGLLNKRAFEHTVCSKINKGTAYMLVMDLDNFKSVNDTCGHMAGDEAIQKAATLLRDTFHEEDIVARFGGDEFVAYLQDWNIDELFHAFNRINEIMKEWSELHFNGIQVSFSMGVVENSGGLEYNDLFIKADEAMYKAKENGKGCYYIIH